MTDHLDDVEFLKRHLSGDLPEELLEQIASTVVDHMADSFPELSLKPRPMEEVLSEFREKKLFLTGEHCIRILKIQRLRDTKASAHPNARRG